MDTYNTLTKLYQRWIQRNKLNPLISADDLLYDHRGGNVTLSNIQEKWLVKFTNVWWKAETHEHEKSKTEEEKCMELWHDYMEWDKRGFSEFFLDEFGITIHDCITYKQLKLLCEVLIPHAKTYYHPRRK